jgi:hypothetical protein
MKEPDLRIYGNEDNNNQVNGQQLEEVRVIDLLLNHDHDNKI